MLAIAPRQLTIVTATLICLPAPVQAQSATPWHADSHAAVRLIAGSMVKSAGATFVRAGIEIKLEPGWKTYWRDPGDSGVPPTFDFTGSENVKAATVLWPAPERFADGAGGHSIGYMGHIILPLRIVPEEAARASALHLKLDYAICGTLCMPAEARLDLALTGTGTEEVALEQAELLVPKRVALGAGTRLAIRSVHREASGAHERVVVEVAAPEGAPVDLYVEGPTSEWALPLPEPDGSTTAPTRRFTFELDGLPSGAQGKGATLTFTAVSGDDAIEVPARLD